jgi:hypothetical protein
MEIRTLTSAGFNLWSQSSADCIGGGTIEIEPSWQMIAIPVTYGYWSVTEHRHIHDNTTPATVYNYVIAQIEDIYGVPANTMIAVLNTLVGGQGNYWNFVPNVTNPVSPHNFLLSYLDAGAGSEEVTGFFVKSIHPNAFTIKWGEN